MKRILIIDNYGSCTFNLVKTLQMEKVQIDVVGNRKICVEEVANYTHLLLSPGPGMPEEAGKLLEIIRCYAKKKPILGICLGYQAIVQIFGGTLTRTTTICHGQRSEVRITGTTSPLFAGVPDTFQVGRYHSWVVKCKDLPDCFESIAETTNKIIMGVRHKQWNVYGLQFHPESILTEHGTRIMHNWLAQPNGR